MLCEVIKREMKSSFCCFYFALIRWLTARTVQQRVNLNGSCALLWGCVVYSCLSSLSLSSTSPAIEPSSPPHKPPQETHTSCPWPHLTPQQGDGEWSRGGNALQCSVTGSQWPQLFGATECVHVLPQICLGIDLTWEQTNNNKKNKKNLLTDVNPNYGKYF